MCERIRIRTSGTRKLERSLQTCGRRKMKLCVERPSENEQLKKIADVDSSMSQLGLLL
jgi:hypothetical protein